MKRAIVIYESIYGNTGRLALAIAEGIKRAGDIECDVVKTNEVHHTDDLVGYDAILFGCPNHNQEPARNMIKFLERAAIVELQGKIGAAFDTYTGGNKGIVVGKLEDLIREKIPGVTLAVDGFSALVEDRKGPLAAGEISQAKEFGNAIGLELLKGS
ncbi:MAG: flavodoxin family protein [Candidatus Thorarchaeota archaeon]